MKSPARSLGDLARYVAPVGGNKEGHGGRYIFRRAEPAEWRRGGNLSIDVLHRSERCGAHRRSTIRLCHKTRPYSVPGSTVCRWGPYVQIRTNRNPSFEACQAPFFGFPGAFACTCLWSVVFDSVKLKL